MAFVFKTVPRIQCGQSSALQLAEELQRLEVAKPLVVTDQGLVAAGILDAPLQELSQQGIDYVLYSQVQADPSEQIVLAATADAVQQRCDSVVGFGGGSSMDVAKLVAVLMQQEQTLSECYGVDQVHSSRCPLLQIPTTAGTGSEVTSVAIVTTGETTKAGVVSDVLFADTVLLDAELTLGLPPAVTAATGIDAMVHAIEAYTSKRLKNPVSDMLAKQALTLLSQNIVGAVQNGDHPQVREAMLLGAMFAGQAFANAPVAAVHALAYPLGGIYHIPHGLSNSLVLPHVLRFNAAAADSLYSELLPAMGLQANGASAAQVLADYFLNLAQTLHLPTSLRDVDITEAGLAQLARESMLQQRLLVNNPREVSEKDALQIYQSAF